MPEEPQQQQPKPSRWIFEGKIDAVVALMFLGLFLALGLLVIVERMFPSDGQVFQVVAGVATTFGGIMAARVDPTKRSQPPTNGNGNGSSSITKPATPQNPPHAE